MCSVHGCYTQSSRDLSNYVGDYEFLCFCARSRLLGTSLQALEGAYLADAGISKVPGEQSLVGLVAPSGLACHMEDRELAQMVPRTVIWDNVFLFCFCFSANYFFGLLLGGMFHNCG